jgi:predicted thioesterase
MSLTPGTRATATLTVKESDLASVLAQQAEDRFPPVLATARLIGLMELAASRVLHPLLSEDQLSVGVEVNVAHTAATPFGATITAEAVFSGMEGKFYLFDVVASDESGEISRGTHKRAIVSENRLLSGASNRCNGTTSD